MRTGAEPSYPGSHQFQLGQSPFAGQTIHDVEFRGLTGHGSEQPFPPGTGLFRIAAKHQGIKRKGGVAHPAITIIPIAHASDTLW